VSTYLRKNAKIIQVLFLGKIIAITLLLSFLIRNKTVAQAGQIAISRIELMPNLPAPYLMRNWKQVAIQYDQLIYTTVLSGQYLPLLRQKASGINYPSLQPILLDTYVGATSSGNQAEAINIIPSLVSASLMGINKSNQNGIDWVNKSKDFFNKANGQNVYLNGYSTTSGNDWWYDLMPNIFFYQLYSQYPPTQDFSTQFTTVADRWLKAVQTMGASTTPWTVPQMNYRAFNLATMTPNGTGVIEPEAAGAISWILYHAWLETKNKKYLIGAQHSMEFLSGLNSNPSYELQLPYGTFVAAKMNAELGTNYDIGKMLGWSFERGSLRGWGTIIGTWNGSNVSGLIGEANDTGNDYAFALNGFQQAAALVPLVKYDKRFARAIGKWMVNLANASRFFYPKYLPPTSQDDFAWSSPNDPNSVIAYEALKENANGKRLYATGDAKVNGWAQTNLGLYGSSSVGYLAALIDTTDISGILLLDVNKTDFFTPHPFPSYLIFNPYPTAKQVTLPLGAAVYEIYDAISETIIKSGATGNTPITISPNEARLLVYLPQGSVPTALDGKLAVGNHVVDCHYGYNFSPKPRIKSLAAIDTLVEFNQQVPIYSQIDNVSSATYTWFVNGIQTKTSSTNEYTWAAPSIAGNYSIRLVVATGTVIIKDSLSIKVVDRIAVPPTISEITSDKLFYYVNTPGVFTCKATNTHGGALVYTWSVTSGVITSQTGSSANWQFPAQEGMFELTCEVTNTDGLKAISKRKALVKTSSTKPTSPLAYYPLDGNTKDYSGNEYHAQLENATPTTDARGELNKAYLFSSSADLIYVSNNSVLNFQNQITLSFWVKLVDVPQEVFILSHGSWEERWKISVTPDKKLRWSVKTATGIKDLDSSLPLVLNKFYHMAVTYSGYSMELYIDGMLDTFIANTGLLLKTGKAISFGKKDVSISNYYLRGSLDEVRIYDKSLSPDEIQTLKTLWNVETITSVNDVKNQQVEFYPNPAKNSITVYMDQPIVSIRILDSIGQVVSSSYTSLGNRTEVVFARMNPGVMILQIETNNGMIYKKFVTE
jgi:hypothetical protein